MRMPVPTKQELEFIRTHLSYGPLTGIVRWRNPPGRRIKDGDEAGSVNGKGYKQIGVQGKSIQLHRLVWFLWCGKWPVGVMDHINGNRLDNNICNLRVVSSSVNSRNQIRSKYNTSGFRGVSYKGWQARVSVKNKTISLGCFPTAEEASAAVEAFYKKLDGSDYLPPRR